MTPLTAAIAWHTQVWLDKQRQIKLTLNCLLARGHLLLEDLPGMGKTTLAPRSEPPCRQPCGVAASP